MASIGLQTPISVRSVNDGENVVPVAGRHRLEAAARLGWDKISVVFVEGDDDDFRLWEIAENLHRSELTVTERSAPIAEWIRITEKNATKKLGQLDPVSGPVISRQVAAKPGQVGQVSDDDKPGQLAQVSKGGRGKTSGISAISREIGVERTEARRAIKIDSITPEAKQAASALTLTDGSQRALS